MHDSIARALRAVRSEVAAGVLLLTVGAAAGAGACSKVGPSAGLAATRLGADAGPTVTVKLGHGSCSDRVDCERRCSGGDGEQCRSLGDALQFDGDAGRDETRAAGYYALACDFGSVAGCLSAGHMYEYHRGVAEDNVRAAGYYRRGCERLDVSNCTNYAIMLENGRGVPKDAALATKLYGEACAVGVGLACDRQRALSSSSPANP